MAMYAHLQIILGVSLRSHDQRNMPPDAQNLQLWSSQKVHSHSLQKSLHKSASADSEDDDLAEYSTVLVSDQTPGEAKESKETAPAVKQEEAPAESDKIEMADQILNNTSVEFWAKQGPEYKEKQEKIAKEKKLKEQKEAQEKAINQRLESMSPQEQERMQHEAMRMAREQLVNKPEKPEPVEDTSMDVDELGEGS